MFRYIASPSGVRVVLWGNAVLLKNLELKRLVAGSTGSVFCSGGVSCHAVLRNGSAGTRSDRDRDGNGDRLDRRGSCRSERVGEIGGTRRGLYRGDQRRRFVSRDEPADRQLRSEGRKVGIRDGCV